MKWAVFGFWGLLTLLLVFGFGVIAVVLVYYPPTRTGETFALLAVLGVLTYLTSCFTREAWGEMERGE